MMLVLFIRASWLFNSASRVLEFRNREGGRERERERERETLKGP